MAKKCWSEEDLIAAIEDIKLKKLSYCEAAAKYGIYTKKCPV